MRRALLLAAAAALPAATLAQVTAPPNRVIEVDNFNPAASPQSSYLNKAQCADTAESPRVNLEWNVPGAASGQYFLFASDVDPATRTGADQNFCLESDTTIDGTDHFGGAIGGSRAVSAAVQRATVSGTAISTAASATNACDTDGKIVWVCAHWTNGQGQPRAASAVGRFEVQLAEPAAPGGVNVGNAPESLTVRWSASTGGGIPADHYIAFARPVPDGSDVPAADAPTFQSSEVNGTGPVTISGLTNGQRYRVHVVAFSVGGNPSPESEAKFGVPTPVDGFWTVYEAAGGREQGGCGAGGAGPVALLGVAGLLAALRRRK